MPQHRSVLGALQDTYRYEQLTTAQQQLIVRQFTWSLAAAIAGYFVGRKYGHPILGTLGGLGAGTSAALAAGGRPGDAAFTALTEAAAVGLALSWPQHPAVGYVSAHVGASLLFGGLVYDPADRQGLSARPV